MISGLDVLKRIHETWHFFHMQKHVLLFLKSYDFPLFFFFFSINTLFQYISVVRLLSCI